MYRPFRNISLFSTKKLQQYLKIMQVPRTITQKQLKIKFIKLAKKYHPDSGSIKDPSRFKSILEAYRYLSNESNWSNDTNTSTTSNTQSKNQKAETKEQKDRKQTYSYFNSKFRGQRGVEDTSSMGYDSFWETLRAAPELKVFTLGFIGLGVMIWIFMVTGMNRKIGPHKTEYEKIFYSKQEEMEYREKQRKRKQRKDRMLQVEEEHQKQYFKSFNFGRKFDERKLREQQKEEREN